ncbi:MAG: glycosyltransferase family 4 protein [Planctomycetes bacterium]|nr:glycosyltransferase family 4 protein [Planctomycetota bacterium]
MNRPLRIAILVDPFTLHVKGGDHAPELARELLGRGHTVRGFGAPEGVIPRSGSDPSAAPIPEGAGLAGFAPDAIIAYQSLSPAAWLGARVARKRRVPLLLVEVGARSEESWRAHFLRRVGETLWGRFVRHHTSAVVALDPGAQERVLGHGFARERVSLVPPGVDLAAFRPGLASGLVLRHHIRGRVLLYLGWIGPGRGLDTLIHAFAKTVGQSSDWSLVLAGDGPARAELRALVDRLGIASCVHWVGTPRIEEVAGLMGSSTLFAVPGLDRSVRGQHIPKAMACGLPVLCSDKPVLNFLVEPEGSGLLVPGGDLGAWTDALRRAAMSPEVRKRWGRRGRELAEERLAWSHIAKQIEARLVAGAEELSAHAAHAAQRSRA